MLNNIGQLLFISILLLLAFMGGRLYQNNFLIEHNDSQVVKAILDKNCVKL